MVGTLKTIYMTSLNRLSYLVLNINLFLMRYKMLQQKQNVASMAYSQDLCVWACFIQLFNQYNR